MESKIKHENQQTRRNARTFCRLPTAPPKAAYNDTFRMGMDCHNFKTISNIQFTKTFGEPEKDNKM